LLLLMLLFVWRVPAQSGTALDYRLINGKIYAYYLPGNVSGNQFLSSPDFSEGTLWLSGKTYRNVLMNLDILNQELLISFQSPEGAKRIISASLAYIDSFYFEGKFFVVERDAGNRSRIYQKIGRGGLCFYFQWTKSLDLRSSLNSIRYEFSNAGREIFLQRKGKRIALSNNRKLYKLFPKEQAAQLRKFMRSHKWKINKMQDCDYPSLLEFLYSLDRA